VILTNILEVIVEVIASGESVTLIGFGAFEARSRKEREGRNPGTGELLAIPATVVPAFSPGKTFKDAVKQGVGGEDLEVEEEAA
jgi:DNA-binding protein HU-beta